jgi:hypothetical protein
VSAVDVVATCEEAHIAEVDAHKRHVFHHQRGLLCQAHCACASPQRLRRGEREDAANLLTRTSDGGKDAVQLRLHSVKLCAFWLVARSNRATRKEVS